MSRNETEAVCFPSPIETVLATQGHPNNDTTSPTASSIPSLAHDSFSSPSSLSAASKSPISLSHPYSSPLVKQCDGEVPLAVSTEDESAEYVHKWLQYASHGAAPSPHGLYEPAPASNNNLPHQHQTLTSSFTNTSHSAMEDLTSSHSVNPWPNHLGLEFEPRLLEEQTDSPPSLDVPSCGGLLEETSEATVADNVLTSSIFVARNSLDLRFDLEKRDDRIQLNAGASQAFWPPDTCILDAALDNKDEHEGRSVILGKETWRRASMIPADTNSPPVHRPHFISPSDHTFYGSISQHQQIPPSPVCTLPYPLSHSSTYPPTRYTRRHNRSSTLSLKLDPRLDGTEEDERILCCNMENPWPYDRQALIPPALETILRVQQQGRTTHASDLIGLEPAFEFGCMVEEKKIQQVFTKAPQRLATLLPYRRPYQHQRTDPSPLFGNTARFHSPQLADASTVSDNIMNLTSPPFPFRLSSLRPDAFSAPFLSASFRRSYSKSAALYIRPSQIPHPDWGSFPFRSDSDSLRSNESDGDVGAWLHRVVRRNRRVGGKALKEAMAIARARLQDNLKEGDADKYRGGVDGMGETYFYRPMTIEEYEREGSWLYEDYDSEDGEGDSRSEGERYDSEDSDYYEQEQEGLVWSGNLAPVDAVGPFSGAGLGLEPAFGFLDRYTGGTSTNVSVGHGSLGFAPATEAGVRVNVVRVEHVVEHKPIPDGAHSQVSSSSLSNSLNQRVHHSQLAACVHTSIAGDEDNTLPCTSTSNQYQTTSGRADPWTPPMVDPRTTYLPVTPVCPSSRPNTRHLVSSLGSHSDSPLFSPSHYAESPHNFHVCSPNAFPSGSLLHPISPLATSTSVPLSIPGLLTPSMSTSASAYTSASTSTSGSTARSTSTASSSLAAARHKLGRAFSGAANALKLRPLLKRAAGTSPVPSSAHPGIAEAEMQTSKENPPARPATMGARLSWLGHAKRRSISLDGAHFTQVRTDVAPIGAQPQSRSRLWLGLGKHPRMNVFHEAETKPQAEVDEALLTARPRVSPTVRTHDDPSATLGLGVRIGVGGGVGFVLAKGNVEGERRNDIGLDVDIDVDCFDAAFAAHLDEEIASLDASFDEQEQEDEAVGVQNVGV
ncbi:hypothetical protein DL93DRAFT_2169429 [Clavulina sp. PMI_390]|nr:hypothetical protein DL93DRAFT_2169429 [Clavulina sp. PMI_390]